MYELPRNDDFPIRNGYALCNIYSHIRIPIWKRSRKRMTHNADSKTACRAHVCLILTIDKSEACQQDLLLFLPPELAILYLNGVIPISFLKTLEK